MLNEHQLNMFYKPYAFYFIVEDHRKWIELEEVYIWSAVFLFVLVILFILEHAVNATPIWWDCIAEEL